MLVAILKTKLVPLEALTVALTYAVAMIHEDLEAIIINVINIHNMITSHSKFATALLDPVEERKEKNDDAIYQNNIDGIALAMNLLSSEEKRFTNSSTKTELLLLVMQCVSLQNTVNVVGSTWKILLRCYNASMSDFDGKIHHLLHLYGQKCQSEEAVLHMDELQWGARLTELTPIASSGNDWEWFIPKLDIRRVLCTLRYFPSCEVEDESNEKLLSGSNAARFESSNNNDNTSTSDIRHSIAFILPLLLAAFESYLPDKSADCENQQISQTNVLFVEKSR